MNQLDLVLEKFFYKLLEQGAELNTVASFLGIIDKSTSTETKRKSKCLSLSYQKGH